MKYFIWVSLVGFLFSGCTKTTSRPHQIICFNSSNHQDTYNVVTRGNVFAFTVKEQSVLCYRNDETNKTELIDLSKNDCAIY